MSAPDAPHPPPLDAVARWLLFIFAFVAVMVLVGGITRLTGSGLSMVEWRPLMGALPPLNDAEWARVWRLYQASPQFEQVNHWMTLAEFKSIFFWEYLHRLLGRLVGVVFALPWLYFALRRRLSGRWLLKTGVAFVLGGLQGVLGWYMVQSGLVDVPAVSHFRLAAHLGLAFVIGQYVLWLALDRARELRGAPPARAASTSPLRRATWAFIALLAVQIVYGAFMAGTRAGYLYSTFPTMNGEWIPTGWLRLEPWWRNLLSGHEAIHFIHRTLGWLIAAAALALAAWGARRLPSGLARRALVGVGVGALAQFGLGALTVVYSVPTSLAAAHQLAAYLLLGAAVAAAHALGGPPAVNVK